MILVSACLLGQLVRYKGDGCAQQILLAPEVRAHLMAVCPEVAGGLPTPRPPAEIQGAGGGAGVWNGSALVKNNVGQDVSDEYKKGALTALAYAKTHNITAAILKERSPSCGTHAIYDGSFSGRKIVGRGVAAAMLADAGVPLYSEEELTPELIVKLIEQDK